ncbi:phospholipase [bacterium]|nr:phospholipase [bacterium]
MSKTFILVLLILYGLGIFYVVRKPLPPGVGIAGEVRTVPAEAITFLADRTYVDAAGERHSEQQIFDEIVRMIRGAKHYVLVDMFLYNQFQGDPPELQRALAQELTAELVAAKQRNPELTIAVVSDPINTVYGGVASPEFDALRDVGIEVVVTDLTKLRDSNPIYSALWRIGPRWLGNSVGGFLPNPLTANGERVPARSWLSLLNFKANHRKLVIADEPAGVDVSGQPVVRLATLVTSANPHDGSSAHTNAAIKVSEQIWQDVFDSEAAAATWSGKSLPTADLIRRESLGDTPVQLLTEGAIRDATLALIDRAQPGDSIDIAMFYLSERSIVRGLTAASKRQVAIRLILDPNKDAFGRTKNGVPNRSVAHELLTKGSDIQIRWCDTHGEQCHTKLLLFRLGQQQVLMTGSANLTRRNINNYNLETNIVVESAVVIPAMAQAHSFFTEMWTNARGRIFTAEYEAYADDSLLKTVMYRIQEATGLSSF